MHEPGGVEGAERPRELQADGEHQLGLQDAVEQEQLAQRRTLDELHDEEGAALWHDAEVHDIDEARVPDAAGEERLA